MPGCTICNSTNLLDVPRLPSAGAARSGTNTSFNPTSGERLLHKHFEPAPGEVFVEHTMRAPRKTETSPIERSAFPEQGLSATAVRFDNSISAGIGVIGMEFAEPDDFDTEPLSDDDEAILTGICERLQVHDKMQRFGVRLIRNPLGLSANELLHETCDSASRTTHCTAGDRDAMLTDHNTIQTAWKWRVVQGGSETVVIARLHRRLCAGRRGTRRRHTASGTDDFDNPTEGEPNEPF